MTAGLGGAYQTPEYHADLGAAAVYAPQEFAAPLEFAVVAIADLNGDGVAEIIATADYYEGNSFAAYSVTGNAPQIVLTCGCGV